MLPTFVKRVLPFMLTLLVGTGLGSVFGWRSSSTNTTQSNVTESSYRYERRYGCSSRYRGNTGGGERRSERTTTPLIIKFQPNTRYTPDALEHKTTGVVQLRVRFNADGTATVVERLSTLPDGLTEEAERVVERTQFTPETVNGEPVAVTKDMNYVFSLSDRATMGL
jgi:outer membrane biosynthesis protein TonB